ESATTTATPRSRSRSRTYAISGPFVSRVPMSRTVFTRLPQTRGAGANGGCQASGRVEPVSHVLAQRLDGLVDEPRVELVGQVARAVVDHELALLGRELDVARLEHVRIRVGRRAVERRDELDGQRAVVADLRERADDPSPV